MTRNAFNLSFEHKTSVDMGELVPVQCCEVLPGDTFRQRLSALTRVAPLAHPLMHRVELRMHSFYVPNRILWDGWEDFITGVDDETPKPVFTMTGSGERVWDYLGVPPTPDLEVDALPLQAYNMIWNEFYRDQHLQEKRDLLDASVARCTWQRDYFTVCRPQPQIGDPVPIPFASGTVPVQVDDSAVVTNNLSIMVGGTQTLMDSSVNTLALGTSGGPPQGLFQVDLSNSTTGINIDDLRRSIGLQRFAEARMRFGERYVDYLRYIGVNPSDGRLDRPEYLGGGKEVLSFSEVLATAETTDANVGDLYGHGIGMGRTNGFTKMFEEHGWLITMLSARPKTVYQDSVPKQFIRKTWDDYWQRELEVLPWQEVSQLEVHKDGDANTVFGYAPRYEEYRHGHSRVSNSLRGGSENDWHMGREFATPPTLNGSFVECTPTERVYQDSNMPDLVINVMADINARRFVGATASMGQDL